MKTAVEKRNFHLMRGAKKATPIMRAQMPPARRAAKARLRRGLTVKKLERIQSTPTPLPSSLNTEDPSSDADTDRTKEMSGEEEEECSSPRDCEKRAEKKKRAVMVVPAKEVWRKKPPCQRP